MHEANTALLDVLIDNSVITGQKVQKLQILLFFALYIAGILKKVCTQLERKYVILC